MYTPGPVLCSGLLLLLSSQLQVSGRPEEFFIKPTLSEDCGNKQPCLTLSDYIQDVDFYFTSHKTFYFLPGNHTVQSHEAISVVVQNVMNLTLTAKQQASVVCEGKLSFSFINILNLSISNLEFVGCGLERSGSSNGKIQAALRLGKIHSLLLQNIHVRESFGYGIFGFNVVGQSKVTGCRFYHNQWRSPAKTEVNNQRHGRRSKTSTLGGNAVFMFLDSRKYYNYGGHSVLEISHSEFAHGTDRSEWYKNVGSDQMHNVFGGGSGLGIIAHQIDYNIYNISVTISNCTFYNNTAPVGANLLLAYELFGQPYRPPTICRYIIAVVNCSFHSGKAYLRGGGIYIHTEYSQQAAKILVQISMSKFSNNEAPEGGGIFLNSSSILEHNSISDTHNNLMLINCQLTSNIANNGGGFYAILSTSPSSQYQVPSYYFIAIKLAVSNTTFFNNSAEKSGGSIYFSLKTATMYIMLPETQQVISHLFTTGLFIAIEVTSCNFTESEAEQGSAMIISGCETEYDYIRLNEGGGCGRPLNTSIIVSNVNFFNNTSPQVGYGTAVLHVNNTNWIILKDSLFDTNNGSGVYVNASNVIVNGLVQFFNNKAHYGGAILLDCNIFSLRSLLYLTSGKLLITNNTAKMYGGAISANEQCINMDLCFFQKLKLQDSREPMVVIMKNNTAEVAGDSIYGGSMESCYLVSVNNSGATIHEQLTADFFARTFKTDGLPSPSNIASRPYKVCFCNESSSLQLQECITTKQMSVFVGQHFYTLAATVGQYRGASPAIVHSKLQKFGKEGQLGARQNIQGLGRTCGNLTYLITTIKDHVELHLTVEEALTSSLATATINVTFLPCPFGFQPSGNPQKCDCAQELTGIPGVWCDIDTITVYRPAAMWIGNYSNSLITHDNCPLDYCAPEDSSLSLWKQDDQCLFNRSGVLCGACQPGLSLALGTSQCLQCSNIYLLLLIPFALAGVALVFLLLKCNLTVSEGTINGLIFYANIVRVNQAIFFPQPSSLLITKILSVFIAWLNLDLGVQVCFFKGMTAYTKACLQFLFPIYIWLLVGIMIVSSRYSSTISKLTGSNAVQVLATLFLLSYAKLLRAIIEAASPIVLTDKSSSVWLMDGNVAFLKGAHIFLFLFALVAMVLYVVPLTLLVLLAPCLQARSQHRLLRWVNKLKPLLDAYQGPYKDEFRYWTGLMLVVRIILFTVFACNIGGDPHVNLLAIIIILAVIVLGFWNFGRVYKNAFVHILEVFFIYNLVFLTATTQFLKTSQRYSYTVEEYMTCAMIGSTFVVFTIILAYHFYHQVRNSRATFIRYILSQCQRKNTVPEHLTEIANAPPAPPQLVADRNQLREPLLTNN